MRESKIPGIAKKSFSEISSQASLTGTCAAGGGPPTSPVDLRLHYDATLPPEALAPSGWVYVASSLLPNLSPHLQCCSPDWPQLSHFVRDCECHRRGFDRHPDRCPRKRGNERHTAPFHFLAILRYELTIGRVRSSRGFLDLAHLRLGRRSVFGDCMPTPGWLARDRPHRAAPDAGTVSASPQREI